MSLLKTNAAQIGQSITTTNNFTLYQPATPDGTVRLGNGNAGSVTDIITLNSSGYVGIGTSSPGYPLDVTASSSHAANLRGRSSDNLASLRFASNANASQGQIYADANGNLGFAASSALNKTMLLDSSGNLGLGVTPKSGSGGTPAFEISGSGTGFTSQGAFNAFSQNVYYASGWKYAANGLAASYWQDSGVHKWFTAPSGTAGNAISFTQAMTLDASGNLSNTGNFVTGGSVRWGGLNAYLTKTGSDPIIGTTDATNLLLYTNGSERMRIDSSGNVGVGTSSPGARLTVQQATNDDTVGASFRGYTTASADGQRTFRTQYADSSVSYYANNQIRAASHQFYINNSEAMRLDSGGNLLLNTTTSNNVGTGAYGDAAQILKPGSGSPAFCAANSWAGGVLYVGKSVGGSGQQFIEFFQQGNSRGTITNTGTGVTYNSASDYRLKENVQPMQNALATVAQLNPVTYTWRETGTDGQGFIAHELQAVIPDAVTGEKDAVDEEGKPKYQGIDTSRIVATLTAAIQELKAELDATKAEVAALKGVK